MIAVSPGSRKTSFLKARLDSENCRATELNPVLAFRDAKTDLLSAEKSTARASKIVFDSPARVRGMVRFGENESFGIRSKTAEELEAVA